MCTFGHRSSDFGSGKNPLKNKTTPDVEAPKGKYNFMPNAGTGSWCCAPNQTKRTYVHMLLAQWVAGERGETLPICIEIKMA